VEYTFDDLAKKAAGAQQGTVAFPRGSGARSPLVKSQNLPLVSKPGFFGRSGEGCVGKRCEPEALSFVFLKPALA